MMERIRETMDRKKDRVRHLSEQIERDSEATFTPKRWTKLPPKEQKKEKQFWGENGELIEYVDPETLIEVKPKEQQNEVIRRPKSKPSISQPDPESEPAIPQETRKVNKADHRKFIERQEQAAKNRIKDRSPNLETVKHMSADSRRILRLARKAREAKTKELSS